MKKLMLVLFIAGAISILQACNGNNKDSAQKADSVNKSKDTSTKPSTDSVTKTAAPAIEVSQDDAKFAVEAANGGMAEVELGQLAQQKAANSQVKDFGAMMVTDHSKAGDELKALATKLKITLPAAINTDEQKIKYDLAKKSGNDFDKAYVSNMIDDHKEDIKVFENAAKNCKDADLKAFANKTLPILNKHLSAIQKIHDSMQ